MDDIFKNAKFGDKFRTRGGSKVLFIGMHPVYENFYGFIDKEANMQYNCPNGVFSYNFECFEKSNGSPFDIIEKWEDEDDRLTIAESKAIIKENTDLKTQLLDLRHIDEAMLDRLAFDQAVESLGEDAFVTQRWYSYTDGFKAGYRKAKEQHNFSTIKC